MFLIFDTETTGLPEPRNSSPDNLEAWSRARLVQLAWQLHDDHGKLLSQKNFLVKPVGFEIPYAAEQIHGISNERALSDGHDLAEVLDVFEEDLAKSQYIVGHNIEFDRGVMLSETIRSERESLVDNISAIDTKDVSTEFCAIPGGKGGKFKWPSLTELHQKLFGKAFEDAHDAAYDVDATARCFFALITQRVHVPKEVRDVDAVVYEAPKLRGGNFKAKKSDEVDDRAAVIDSADVEALKDATFAHLHCHSQFSILQSTSTTGALVDRSVELGMSAVALTDHGNMMGAFHFVKAALDAGIKPVLGCEFNMCKDRLDKSYKDDGYQVVLLAKTKEGYHNLAKLASSAYTEGFYYVPRIDRNILLEHKDDLIALSGGLWGEISSLVLNVGEKQAEEAFCWWKENFGEDFYAELLRHGVDEEKVVNRAILKFCAAHDVKYIATNNTYYTTKDQSEPHDVLLCVKDAESVSKPKRYIGKRGREFRFGFPNDEFYLKSGDEMKELFADLPKAILNVQEIVDKVHEYTLARDVLLPAFEIPEEFCDPQDDEDGGKRGENNYLRHLTYEGAQKRYPELTDEIRERLDFELQTIENTGYPGYFLIVQDFCQASRDMGVSVGPGRGSAAGSAVAYCTGITNIDPIEYDLLFERFLNPDRVSLPDIDIDFDDEGRDRVIQYVIDKYGENQVAQIITYGTMAAKSSIRDTGRVMELPLSDTDRLAKLVPDIKLRKLFGYDDAALKDKFKTNQEDLEKAKRLLEISQGQDLEAETINTARVLEGSVRNTGIHACGVIITPDDITNFVPVATAKDSDMWCTQFDNSVVENAGLLKMDFLGLKTLTLIKDTVRLVKEGEGVDLDPENFPLDDELTYALFQRGETVGIFQYESPGMQRHMKDLKPSKFADLIAMNALYRPGPLQYIPSFIKRKHGEEEIAYDLPECAEYLEETYGITVYQEQVMLLSQKLAGFTKGEADVLRKAMGKKIFALLQELEPKFINQGAEKGHPKEVLKKIWKDWEHFAAYAFNKSHSTCYAWVAYQTAYLKAHYPAEYMASVLSNNMNDIKQVTFFMEECRRMGIPVLGPCVNESSLTFRVNDQGAIRFGLGAVKGVGESAVESIVDTRKEGAYASIFDFVRRVDLRAANKKAMESLAFAGAFDAFRALSRHQYFAPDPKGVPFLELAVKYGNAYKQSENSDQQSLFSGENTVEIPEPPIPHAEPWTALDQLGKEKEVVGIYISGHPLDDYRLEMNNFCTAGGLSVLEDLTLVRNKELRFAGMLNEVGHKFTQHGKPYGVFNLEDYENNHRFFLFGDDYVKFKDYLVEGWFLFIGGKVQPKRFAKDPDDLEFKIHKVELLADVREKLPRFMNLNLNLSEISEEFTEDFYKLLTSYKGSCRVKVRVKHMGNVITMPAKNLKVELTNELIDALDKLPEVEYSLE